MYFLSTDPDRHGINCNLISASLISTLNIKDVNCMYCVAKISNYSMLQYPQLFQLGDINN